MTQGTTKSVPCDNLEWGGGWGGRLGGRLRRGHIHLWLIHVDIQQKSTQYFKAIFIQLKINLNLKKCTEHLSERNVKDLPSVLCSVRI